jgi:HAE1 family hydrophobic/amphiphilic exporter-1
MPLADLVTFTRSTSPAEIARRDLTRQVTVDANLDQVPLGTASAAATRAGESLKMAPGYKLAQGGDAEMMFESFGYMGEALVLAVILVYLILAAQFESFIDPLAIMLSLPLSIVGMAGTLVLTGDTINIMSLIGLIMLMGLVTKNAILLVDFTKVLRADGMDRRTALITAGRTRLRPILMTTSAMIFGMLPLFFALGEGAEFRAPMARAVVGGGLITSTLLTLIVVPVVYTVLDDISGWLFRRRKREAAVAVTTVVALLIVLGAPSAARAQGPAAAPSIGQQAAQAGAAASQPAPGAEVRVLTLDQALALAAAQNRDIQKAIEYQKWVQGKYVEERAGALPTASFSGSALRTSDNSTSKLYSKLLGGGGGGGDSFDFGDAFGGRTDTRSATFQVTQPIFTWGQVGAAIRAAKMGFNLADSQLKRYRQAVVKDVSAAFYDVLLARELASISEQDLAQKQRHLDEAVKRQSTGTATDYDVLAAQVSVENARPNVIRGHNTVRVAREQLRFLLAETSHEVDATGSLATSLEPVPSYETVLAEAYQNRPELAEMRSQKGVYGELVTIAKAGNKPRVDFSAEYGRKNLAMSTVDATGTAWNAAIIAKVPLFDGWRTKGRVAQAQSDVIRLGLEEQQLRDSIALQVRTSVDAVREASEIVTGMTGTVKQAEKLLFLAEKGFELGVKTRLEVQDAELNLQSARANLARAQRDYRVARVNLAWVSGNI